MKEKQVTPQIVKDIDEECPDITHENCSLEKLMSVLKDVREHTKQIAQ